MNKQKQRWKTIYFDGFAGAGERIQKGSTGELKFEFVYPKTALEDLGVFRGSIRRILELPQPYWFDWYYFVDINPEATESIKRLVEEIRPNFTDRIQIRQSDCNEQLKEMANKALKSGKYAALVFLDPFGMQIRWESIATLKNTRSDVWLLLPSGVAINRLLPRKGEIRNPKTLEAFFGLSIDEIRGIFYTRRTKPSLFGSAISVQEKRPKPIERIVELYRKQLKTIWNHVSEEPLVLKNSRNSPLYHFIFASNNPVAVKIASQIIQKRQR